MHDMDEYEKDKENFLPLPQGRKLNQVTNNEEERAKMLASLTESSSFDDYWNYMEFTKQAFPAGHRSISQQRKIAISLFSHDPSCANDKRYLSLWMNLAKKQQDPRELFKYLSVNEIGQELCLFYEEYAAYHESNGRWDEAEEIYQLGINRKAQPLDRLKRLLNDFHKRKSEIVPDEPEVVTPKKMTATIRTAQPLKPQNNAMKMKVFEDKEEVKDDLFPKNANWDQFVDESVGTKENQPTAEKWAGQTLKQKSKTIVPRMDVFQVFPSIIAG
jgi:checkpoint serine/threonine-protein kinase